MYIPRLRKKENIIKNIKPEDKDSAFTTWQDKYIEFLSKKTMAL